MENDSHFDPGTGARFKTKTKRIINKDGSFNIRKDGARFGINDAYLVFIRMSWWQFFAALMSGYLLTNLFFAAAYYMLGDSALSLASSISEFDQFIQCFYFSTQTFTTLGYGAISPSSNAANLIASFEAFVGFLSFSLATGLLFGRFSKPNARIRFSEFALIQVVNGTRSIAFRIANERPGNLMEMSCTVILNMTHPDKDEVSRIYKRLELQINRIEFFPLNWTIVHPIDENSPLFKMSDQEIINHDGEMLIHVKGFDEMFSQQVHRRFSYTLNELKLGYRFKRAFHVNDDGEIVLDLEKLDDIEPEPSART